MIYVTSPTAVERKLSFNLEGFIEKMITTVTYYEPSEV